MRTPTLLLPMTMSTPTMRIFRGLQALTPAPAVPAGLRATEHWIPQDGDAPAVRVVSFERRVTSKPRAAMLWLHGGGFVCGRPEQDMALVARMLERLDVLIVSVDYRLAPEHPFPAPLDDAYAILAWLAAHAADLATDPDRIVVGGQSAGGGLAAALVQRTVDHGPVRLIFQLLVYPMLDVATTRRHEHDLSGPPAVIGLAGAPISARSRPGWAMRPTPCLPRANLGDMPPSVVTRLISATTNGATRNCGRLRTTRRSRPSAASSRSTRPRRSPSVDSGCRQARRTKQNQRAQDELRTKSVQHRLQRQT